MKVYRWPAFIVIVGLLVAGFFVTDEQEPPTPRAAVSAMPVASRGSADTSTWYCLMGSGAGNDYVQKQTVVVGNFGDEERHGTLTAYTENGASAVQDLTIAPGTRQSIETTGLVESVFLAALVEVDGGEVAVSQVVEGQWGSDVGECETVAASEWHVAAGSTQRGEHLLYLLFNPFPDLVNVDISFETEDGQRLPTDYQPLIVPPHSVIGLTLEDVVTTRDDVAGTLRTRGGRVVVSTAVGYDGSEGLDGLAIASASPVPEHTWLFPTGVKAEGLGEEIFVYNPGERDSASVDVQIVVDDPAATGSVPPIELTVGPGEVVTVGSDDEIWSSVPDGGHSIIVQSTNDVPVVAERLLIDHDPRTAGVRLTPGTPLTSTDLLLSASTIANPSNADLVVMNPNTQSIARVTATIITPDGEEILFQDKEIDPGSRLVEPLTDAVRDRDALLRVTAGTPIAAEVSGDRDDPSARFLTRLVPLAGTTERPPAFGD